MKIVNWIAVVIIALFVGFVIGLETYGKLYTNNTNTDTVYVDRIIEIPAKPGEFVNENPKPIEKPVTDKYSKRYKVLLEDYIALRSDYDKLTKYKEAIEPRVYENKYSDTDGVVDITVIDSVTGTLDYQNVKFLVNSQKIPIKEKIITNTREKVFSLSGGISLRSDLRTSIENNTIEFNAGVGLPKGWELMFGYDTDEYFRMGLKKDIFTIYK